jgi:hypothetical protein
MPSNSVFQLYSFDSGYSLVVLGKAGGGIREDQILQLLKNNQNQTNTTGTQNLKASNNTAGWLSVFFFVFF